MKKTTAWTMLLAAVLYFGLSGSAPANPKPTDDKKVWAWMSGKLSTTPEQWEHFFSKAEEAGIDAILLECHGGYQETVGDTTDFTDREAITIIQNALPYARKHGIELHAWMWTMNRTEKNLRAARPELYQVNGKGESCLDIKLYNREHYRFLCPTHPETAEYLKARVAELAKIDGLAGVHLDFIRYPDAILPYGLHESRGVVQDKVYPTWDHCYCDACRAAFKAQTGIDPLTLEDPTSNRDWMNYRWNTLSEVVAQLGEEIHKHGKVSSCAVFASPEESKKLVRQDWGNFRNIDILFPMIYHGSYAKPDPWVETATREGVEALKAHNNPAQLCSGVIVSDVPKDRIDEFIGYMTEGGSEGICFFSLNGVDRVPGYWEALGTSVRKFKGKE